MNLLFQNLLNQRMNILVIGLDGAGKTTLLNNFTKGGLEIASMIGFDIETYRFGDMDFHSWDVGGPGRTRILWRYYLQKTNGIIFVVDSTDEDRIKDTCDTKGFPTYANDELHQILSHELLLDAPLLVYANKNDLPQALPIQKIRELLELNKLERPWHIQACSALTGDGLNDGMDWLRSKID